jgi:DNA-binding transcriptional LysR family regulator
VTADIYHFTGTLVELEWAIVQLKQVHYFLAICKDKSFTRAAKRCGVAQPTITTGIRSLEATLGADLFVRQPFALTAFGQAVRPELEQLAESYERLLRHAQKLLDRK